MTLLDLILTTTDALVHRAARIRTAGEPSSLPVREGRLVATVGNLQLYRFDCEVQPMLQSVLLEDMPVTWRGIREGEEIEGRLVGWDRSSLAIHSADSLGHVLPPGTLALGPAAFFDTIATRLRALAQMPERFNLPLAERLLPWLDVDRAADEPGRRTPMALAALSTIWQEQREERHAKLAAVATELTRANKRLLVIAPDHLLADQLTGVLARALRAAGLPFRSLLSRYEAALQPEAEGVPLQELSFEAQMHQFYARAHADKAALRRKYERFRELTPLLTYKAEKQKDLDEVKLLEWRLLTQMTELQERITQLDKTLAEYQDLPLLKRLTMQAVGKNMTTLPEYRAIYEQTRRALMAEVAKAREGIAELAPEAAVPKELRSEYQELKEEIIRLGGLGSVRELLVAEEATNRQAFIQNKRVLVTTAARLASDPLFERIRCDALLVDHAPEVPGPWLLLAACCIREKIILSGDPATIPTAGRWMSPWPEPFVQTSSS